METTTELDSPNDFLVKFNSIKSLDESFRCAICLEVLMSPTSLKECFHTFCSSCIRTFITFNLQQKDRSTNCPTCSKEITMSSLIVNQPLDQSCKLWLQARQDLLLLQSTWESTQLSKALPVPVVASSSTTRVPKASTSTLPSTRSSRSKTSSSQLPPPPAPTPLPASSSSTKTTRNGKVKGKGKELELVIEDSSDEENNQAKEEDEDSDSDLQILDPNDPNIEVECPLCQKKFKNSNLNFHIDNLHGEKNLKRSSSKVQWSNLMSGTTTTTTGNSGTKGKGKLNLTSTSSTSSSASKQNFLPLPSETYSLLSATSLVKKLKELDLPFNVPEGKDKKFTLERRHRRFTAIWNANCDLTVDDTRRKSKKKLIEELIKWETLQDVPPIDIGNLKKYQKTHHETFKELTAQAKASMKAVQPKLPPPLSPSSSHPPPVSATSPPLDPTSPITVEEVEESEDVIMADSIPIPKSIVELNQIPDQVQNDTPNSPVPIKMTRFAHSSSLSPTPATSPPPLVDTTIVTTAKNNKKRTRFQFELEEEEEQEVSKAPKVEQIEEQEEEDEEEEEEEEEWTPPRPSQRVKADEEIIDWARFDRDAGESDNSDEEE